MKKINIYIIPVIIFITLLFRSITAQENQIKNNTFQNQIKIEHISNDLGIPTNLVFEIYQDSKGFMWFGTMFGLVRYDGDNYKTYRHDPSDKNSLSNDDIISIFEDKDGYIWIGTYNGGLNRYDRRSGNFTRFFYDPNNENTVSDNTIWDIIQDKNGTIWFATESGGLCKFENDLFTSFKHDSTNSKSISGNKILTLSFDNDGNIWAGSTTGLNKLDVKKGEFTVYKFDKENENSIGSNVINSLLCDSYGDIWAGTGGGGLNKFERGTGDFKRYVVDSGDVNSISSNVVISVLEEEAGVLGVGTGNGFNRFYVREGKFEKVKLYPDKEFNREVITRMYKDNSGVLWLSNYQEGLHKVIRGNGKFQNYLENKSVHCFYENPDGTIWIGTTQGLLKVDNNFNILDTYLNDKNNQNSISSNFVRSLTKDINGNLWIGTSFGLNKYNESNKTFTKYLNSPEDEHSLSNNGISRLLTDNAGKLWVGTDFGLNEYLPAEKKFKRYLHSPTDMESLSENSILSIYEDKSGSIWVGTYSGLNKMDRATGKFSHFSHDPLNDKTISNNYIYSFCEDASGNFWIGTGGGLNKFDPATESFLYFIEKNGLDNSVIAGIVQDVNGNLWLSTINGLSLFNINNNDFRNFNTSDGLSDNMFNFSSYMKTSDGRILFGSVNGVTSVNPADIINSSFTPQVLFTDLIRYNENSKFTEDISALKDVSLSYKDNVINIGFSSSDFTHPDKIKYSYMLEGFDKDWIQSGKNRNAVYTNLDPGNYIFKVISTNSDGVKNESVSELKFSISPPFWKTWWFYTLILSLLIFSIILIQNIRVRSKVNHLLELEKVRESEREKVREQASRDYHDELGHKLTRISLYSRRVNKKLQAFTNGISEDLKFIVETSNSLQSGAKDLIWTMNPQEDTLYDFAVRLKDFGNELFDNNGMEFHSGEISEELREIRLSMNCKRHLIYIFKEGMNNILKYSECENVKLNFRIYDEDVEIILEDDGIGFDPANCQKGYGLKNIFSRAAQIDLNVNISSMPGAGTKITLTAGIQNLISVFTENKSSDS